MHFVSYLHKLLEQSNQIDVDLTGANIQEQNADYDKDLKRGKPCRSSRMAANEMAAASV